MQRDQLLENVRRLMQEALRMRFEGGAHAQLAKASGYADGYMRALIDAGVIDHHTLLDVVGDTRRRFAGVEPLPAA